MAQQTRKDPRAKVLSMTVRYKSATLDEFIEHHSHDVSRGGMFIKTPQPFPPGTLLKFEVRIAEDRKVMQGVGRVVWKRDFASADAERPAGMGVKFIKLDDDSRRLIDQLLSSRRDEVSAFDAEASQPGVDTEVPVGLGAEPLSIPASGAGSEVRSFFPKTDPADLPAPEDRTVMKQAAELLEEALREVGTDEPAAPKPKSLSPAGVDETEDTKPGRALKNADSGARLPAPKMPAMKGGGVASGSSQQTPHSEKSGATVAGVHAHATEKEDLPAGATVAQQVGSSDLASAARGITDKARQLSTSKAPAPGSAKSSSGSAVKSNVAASPAVRSVPAAGKNSAAQATAAPGMAPASTRGSGRALFWFLAVAACAAGTWWIWKPRPAELVPSPPVQTEPLSKTVEPVAAEPVAAERPAAAEQPTIVADAAVSAAPASAVAQASAAPEATSQADASAVVLAVPAPKIAAPTGARVVARPRAATASAAEAPAGAGEPAAAAPEAPAAKEVPADTKPVAPTPVAPTPEPGATPAPVAKPAPAEEPTPPAATKKRKAAADSDNPY